MSTRFVWHSPASTQAIRDAWVASSRTAILKGPGVVVPVEFNYVVNPGHRDFAQIRIGSAMPFPFDPRLSRP